MNKLLLVSLVAGLSVSFAQAQNIVAYEPTNNAGGLLVVGLNNALDDITLGVPMPFLIREVQFGWNVATAGANARLEVRFYADMDITNAAGQPVNGQFLGGFFLNRLNQTTGSRVTGITLAQPIRVFDPNIGVAIRILEVDAAGNPTGNLSPDVRVRLWPHEPTTGSNNAQFIWANTTGNVQFFGDDAFTAATGTPPVNHSRFQIRLLGTQLVAGDTDRNGCVDDADLTNLILDFGAAGGSSSTFPDSDLNGDGIVDDADLTELILNFGTGC